MGAEVERAVTELEKRVHATTKTEEFFKDKPFAWDGQGTCIHLARRHAQNMGHKLPIVPRFRSALGAKKALKAMGVETLPELLDLFFVQIPPAFARVGDLLAADSDDGAFAAIMVRGGTTKALGWHEDADGCTIIDFDMGKVTGAWRL